MLEVYDFLSRDKIVDIRPIEHKDDNAHNGERHQKS